MTWLRHAESGGYFDCPDGAVDHMREKGWEPSDPPPEPVNPAVAERLAWLRASADKADTTSPKPARRGSPEE